MMSWPLLHWRPGCVRWCIKVVRDLLYHQPVFRNWSVSAHAAPFHVRSHILLLCPECGPCCLSRVSYNLTNWSLKVVRFFIMSVLFLICSKISAPVMYVRRNERPAGSISREPGCVCRMIKTSCCISTYSISLIFYGNGQIFGALWGFSSFCKNISMSAGICFLFLMWTLNGEHDGTHSIKLL